MCSFGKQLLINGRCQKDASGFTILMMAAILSPWVSSLPHDALVVHALLHRISLPAVPASAMASPVLIPIFGLLVVGAAVGIRSLQQPGRLEREGLASRSQRLRAGVARNIAIRKAAASLQHARTLEAIREGLKECLIRDFDGFTLTIDPTLLHSERPGTASQGLLESQWNNDAHARYRLRIEIAGPSLGTLGELLLLRSSPLGLMVDPQLLTRELSLSLGSALEQWITGAISAQ